MNIRIKEIGERAASKGVFLADSSNERCRKLEPGEVVTIPEGSPIEADVMAILSRKGSPIEITAAPATRPLEYENRREAKNTSPYFEPTQESDLLRRDEIRAKVAERMAKLAEPEVAADEPEKRRPGRPRKVAA